MKNVSDLRITWVIAVIGLLCTSWASAQQEAAGGELQPGHSTAADYLTGKSTDELLFLTCDETWKTHLIGGPEFVDAPKLVGAPADVSLDGKLIRCPVAERPPWLVALPHIFTSGVASKLYFFSNIGTQSQLDEQLRKVGIRKSWIKKNSPSLFLRIKSRSANRIFGVLALAEGVYGIYEFFAGPSPRQVVLRPRLDTTSAPPVDCKKRWGLVHRMLCSEVKP